MILVELVPPVTDGKAVVSELRKKTDDVGFERTDPTPADALDDPADRVATLVAAGNDQVIVSLDHLPPPDADGVHRITDFVWSVLATGALPVVVAGNPDTADVVRHYKMDRAFVIVADLETAWEHLQG